MIERKILSGLAVGDALGQPFEFCTLKQIADSKWDGTFTSGGTWKRKAGEWTDDTKMAKALAESLVELGRFDQENVASKYLAWFQSGDLRGIGVRTERALSAYAAGKPLAEIGNPQQIKRPSFVKRQGACFDNLSDLIGNGTLMRCAPIAVAYRKDTAAMLEAAKQDANITHNHPLARDASYSLCWIISSMLNGMEPRDAVQKAAEVTYEYPQLPIMFKKLEEALKSPSFDQGLGLGVRGTANDTLATALYCFLTAPDFKTAVVTAVLLGGDTDTRAAVTGALAAAVWEIPDSYLSELESTDAIQLLDRQLWNL